MGEASSWWAVAAVTITALGGVATAWVGGRERRQEIEVPAPDEAPAEWDLRTIAGLAAAVTQTTTAMSQATARIAVLEEKEQDTRERVAALWRYIRLLRSTIRGLGAPVPDPEPGDRRHLIEQ